MALFRRSDRIFEEAARDDAACDALIKRLQRDRKGFFILIVGLSLVILIPCVWGLVILTAALLRTPIFPMSRSAEFILSIPRPLIFGVAAQIFIAIAVALVRIWHLDACIKFLLFARASKART